MIRLTNNSKGTLGLVDGVHLGPGQSVDLGPARIEGNPIIAAWLDAKILTKSSARKPIKAAIINERQPEAEEPEAE